MASTPSVNDLKAAYQIDSNVKPATRLDFSLANAIRGVKKTLGVSLFNIIFPDTTPTGLSDEDQIRFDDIHAAIIKLAMAEVLTNVNLRIRDSGQIKEENTSQSELSTGNVTVKYLTPDEVQKWKSSLIAEANGLIGIYVETASYSGLTTTRIQRA